jgi:hypothetical protein
VDVENAEGKNEGVDDAEDDEGDGCLARRQEGCHCVGGSQDPIDYPKFQFRKSSGHGTMGVCAAAAILDPSPSRLGEGSEARFSAIGDSTMAPGCQEKFPCLESECRHYVHH